MTELRPTDKKKSCFRCGKEFDSTEGQRVCADCRTPKSAQETGYLSVREKQVVELVVQGKANKQIAFDLFLTEGTIKEYLNRIFRKVNVKNRTELAVWALMQQLAA